jgi:alkanesulfonate monooxygenase SsuD/methylene tetrahydromethanopterin reductase-like flavin-dependent oxidoreductase (luciferase family)
MSLEIETPAVAGTAQRNLQAVFKRVRFVDEPSPGSTVLSGFCESGRCATIEDVADCAALPTDHRPGDAVDILLVALLPPEAADEAARLCERWMVGDQAPAQVAPAGGALKIAWRPGRAIVQGTPSDIDVSLQVLTRFAFCDEALRNLESALDNVTAQAMSDVARVYHVRHRDRRQRSQLIGLAEHFSRLRLDFVQLAPLLAASYRLPLAERDLLARLLEKGNVPARLEAVSDRLEAYETLYQDAVDRIAQHHWAVEGHWLEIIIIVLLLLELMATTAEVFFSHTG